MTLVTGDSRAVIYVRARARARSRSCIPPSRGGQCAIPDRSGRFVPDCGVGSRRWSRGVAASGAPPLSPGPGGFAPSPLCGFTPGPPGRPTARLPRIWIEVVVDGRAHLSRVASEPAPRGAPESVVSRPGIAELVPPGGRFRARGRGTAFKGGKPVVFGGLALVPFPFNGKVRNRSRHLLRTKPSGLRTTLPLA